MLHHFTRSIAHIALPDKFTYPFITPLTPYV